MKKFGLSVAAAFGLGLIAVFIGTIVWMYGLNANGSLSEARADRYLVYYTEFLVVFCAVIVIAKIDQLRDDLHKK